MDEPAETNSNNQSALLERPLGWPDEPHPDAFSGLAGDAVRVIEPHTEAAGTAILIQLLVAFGNVIGDGPHFMAGAVRHALKLFCVLVGRTSKVRKGSSFGFIRKLLELVDSGWVAERLQSGVISGEGLIWAVRDQVTKEKPVKDENGRVGYDTVVVDRGASDKRLLVLEKEFSAVLQVAGRPGNILSSVARKAWDDSSLRTLAKNKPIQATGAHVSIIGHTTCAELRRHLTRTEMANGFANRFLWICAERSKLLPEGGLPDPKDLDNLAERLKSAVGFARGAGELKRDDQARTLWHEAYQNLAKGDLGLLGAVTSRAEAQVMRMACVYALLDRSSLIRVEHLRAALAVWDYAARSARFIFGDDLGNPAADRILDSLREEKKGRTRQDIRELFHRHKSSFEIAQALDLLKQVGLARMEQEDGTGGRPAERWFAVERDQDRRGP
jgi:hypothetical protein